MNKNHTLKELADIGAKAASVTQMYENDTHLVQMNKGSYGFNRDTPARETFAKAVLDAVGYEFPKDEEREAFDAWATANNKLATTDQFEAWKAGREELRRAQSIDKQPAEPTDKSEFPDPPASGMKVCYWQDMPKDSNPYGKSMWAFGGWVGLYADSNPAPDTIVAYLPESKVNKEYLTADKWGTWDV